MASVYSEASWTGDYTYTRVRVDYSGTSATAHLLYTRTNTYSGATSATNATFSFGGASTTFSYTAYGQQTDLEIASLSFTISTSGGTYSGSSTGNYMGGSWSVTIPSQATAPSGGYINGVTSEWNTSAGEIRVSTTSAGVTNTGGASLSQLNWGVYEQAYVSGLPRVTRTITNGASSTLGNSLNDFTGTAIDVAPNKLLYLGLYAYNGVGEYRYQGGTIVTVSGPVTITNTGVTTTTATFSYTTTADGGYYAKSIQYSLDGGTTWVTAATVNTGSATTDTFTITGLTAGTTYNIQTRANTTAGSTSGSTLSITTQAATVTPKLYGSVNGQTKKITKLYGSVNGETKKITKLYGSVNGVTKLVYEDSGA